MAVSEVEKAWVAGVLDSVSHAVTIRENGHFSMDIHFKEEGTSFKLSNLVGTNTRYRAPRFASYFRKPCLEHCPDQHEHVYESPIKRRNIVRISGVRLHVVVWGVRQHLASNEKYRNVLDFRFSERQKVGSFWDTLEKMALIGWEVDFTRYSKQWARKIGT
jgi:hypothetical protein